MITLTDAAAEKIKDFLKRNNIPKETGGMGFGLKSGGCAGMRYFFKPRVSPDPADTVFEHDGARLFVDDVSLKLVDGSTIDWGTVHEHNEAFIVTNPNASGSCGCGISIQFDSLK